MRFISTILVSALAFVVFSLIVNHIINYGTVENTLQTGSLIGGVNSLLSAGILFLFKRPLSNALAYISASTVLFAAFYLVNVSLGVIAFDQEAGLLIGRLATLICCGIVVGGSASLTARTFT